MNFIKIVKFDFMNILRSRMLLIVNTIFPIALFLGISLITNSNFGGKIKSYDYYGVSTMIFSAMLISMTAVNVFMEKAVKRGNVRVLYAPVTKVEIYFSKLIATYVFGTISYSLISIIEQYIFHSNFGGKNIIHIIILINILSLFACSLGIMFCCVFKKEEAATALTPLVALVFVFFGGFFSPVGHLGKSLQTVASFSPVKWVTDCTFRIIYDNDFSIYPLTLAILLIGTIICIAICQIVFKPEDYI